MFGMVGGISIPSPIDCSGSPSLTARLCPLISTINLFPMAIPKCGKIAIKELLLSHFLPVTLFRQTNIRFCVRRIIDRNL